MKSKNLFWKLLIPIVMLGIGWYLYPQLPNPMPNHWNIDGQADAYGNPLGFILGMPGLLFVMIIMFQFLPQLDPRKEKYQQFSKTWEIIQFIILGFFFYIYLSILYVVLHPGTSINPFMLAGLGMMFIFLGNYITKIRSNYFVGIKTPWSIDNEEVWKKTHRLGGPLFVIGGIILLLQAYFQKYLLATLILVLGTIVLVPIIYSYIIFKKTKKHLDL